MIEALRAEPQGHFTSTCPAPVRMELVADAPQVQDTLRRHWPEPVQSPQPHTPPQVPARHVTAASAVSATVNMGPVVPMVNAVATRADFNFLFIVITPSLAFLKVCP